MQATSQGLPLPPMQLYIWSFF